MDFTDADIRRLADLARLALRDDEISSMRQQLGAIADYVAQLQAVDTTGVTELANVAGLENVLRADEPSPLLNREVALANAPLHDHVGFLVPKVVER